ncbi:hypothetical protein BFP72_11665 [Reichenbachiella sp. 5M10]|uniref:histidine kinase n=1 Tax=Reichenbachiella sp. 5M10 TaxID=1889772 RepID=UPI000C154432|nr:histidine kinase [Reichenbachiella sp. 5M10]PIB36004.1 hypothetical protein BFP72_11665 [Reichenbachiella sp. 5M10]
MLDTFIRFVNRGNKYLSALFVVVLIAIATTFFLTDLISDQVNQANNNVATHSFQNKYQNIKHEFSLYLKPITNAQLFARTNDSSVADYVEKVLQAQSMDSLVYRNWYFIETNGDIGKAYFNSRKEHDSSSFTSWRYERSSIIKDEQGAYYWRNQSLIETEQGSIHMGYDLDLVRLHDYIGDLDSYAISYAYVFDQKGMCLLHPDVTRIGQNVFDFNLIEPADTTFNERNYSKRVVKSEYLQINVTNYIRKLQIGGSTWFVSVNFPNSIHEEDINLIKKYVTIIYIVSTSLLLFLFYFFSFRLRREYREKEQLQQEKSALALQKEVAEKQNAYFQLQQLKNQINPHMLFNSLNTLYTLVDKDQNLSKQFVHKLSKLYRYLTDRPENNICTVNDELEIVREYLFMQKIRFDNRLVFEVEIMAQASLYQKVPYLAVQTVVENAIKHNIATTDTPLIITIMVDTDLLTVKNNYQPKRVTQDSGEQFGLRYLRSIYEYYHCDNFGSYIENGHFNCQLPYLT